MSQNLSLLFFVAAMVVVPQVSRAADCSQASLLKSLGPYVQADAAAGDLWPNFHFTQEPIVLIDLGLNTCAHLFMGGQLVKSVTLSKPWSKGTYGFDFAVNPKRYPNYPGVTKSFFPEQIIDKNGVWRCCELVRDIQGDLNSLMDQVGLTYVLVYWMNDKSVTYNSFQISTMAHETFHFFYQNRGLGGKPWPKLKFSSIDNLNTCYRGNDQVRNTLAQELSSLVLANSRMVNGEARIDEAVRDFVRYRRLRYQQVQGLDCGQIESVRESVEGTAQYIGVETIRRLGLMTDGEYIKYVQGNLSNVDSSILYYFTGLAQLNLIKYFQGRNFMSVASSISQASAPLKYVDVLENSL